MRKLNVNAVFTIVGVISAAFALIALFVPGPLSTPTKPTHQGPFDYFPYLLILIGLLAIVILATGFLAARAGIGKRQRRLDLVERLIANEALTEKDKFAQPARDAYVTAVGEFAKDLIEVSKTVSRREAADMISARQIRRAAELLSLGIANRRGSNLGSFGGILLGAGLAEMFVILTSPRFSQLGIGLAFAASMIGVILLAYQWFSG